MAVQTAFDKKLQEHHWCPYCLEKIASRSQTNIPYYKIAFICVIH